MGVVTRRALLLIALLAAGCGSEPAAPDEAQAPPDTASAPEPALAPDFTLTSLDGEPFTLSEHRGEVVVLNFWATWCLPCIAEMPELDALQREFEGDGLVVVGISQDAGGADAIRPFAAEVGVSYPLLPDPAFVVASRYGGIAALPTTIFVARDGTIAREEVGALSGEELREFLGALL